LIDYISMNMETVKLVLVYVYGVVMTIGLIAFAIASIKEDIETRRRRKINAKVFK